MGFGKDPGNLARTIVINGEEYDATPEALAELDKRGVKYGAPEKGMWEGLRETVQDFGRGAAHGASFGLADKKFGDDAQSLMQRLGGDDYSVVTDRSPIASTVGDVSGSVLSPMSKLGMAAKGAGMAARVGRAALGGAVESGVRGFSDDKNALDEATQGAEVAGGVSAGLAGLGALAKTAPVGRAAEAAMKMVSNAADSARLKGTGFNVKELKALAQKSGGTTGDQLASDTADRIERLSGPTGLLGESAADKGRKFEAIRKQMGADIGGSLETAGRTEGLDAFVPDSQGQQGVWTNIQQRLLRDANALKGSAPEEFANRNAAVGFADRLAAEAPPSGVRGLHERVHDFGEQAYGMNKANKAVSTLETSAGAKASEMGRDIARDELGSLIDNYATPETASKFRDSMKGFSDVIDLERVAKERGTTEAATANTLGTFAPAILATAGGLVTGGLGGAALGGGMALGSGTRNAIRQLAETSQGFDATANLLRKAASKGGYSKVGPQATRAKLDRLAQLLAAQGNRRGLVATESLLPDYFDDGEE